MPRQDIATVEARSERAWAEKRTYYSDWYEIGRFFRPGTDPYLSGQGAHEGGRSRAQTASLRTHRYVHLYDATGMESAANHADELVATLFTPGRPWAKLRSGPLFAEGAQDDEKKQLLQTAQDKTFEAIHASNFVLSVNAMVYDGDTYGTGCMKGGISRDTATLLEWDAVSQSEVAFQEGPRGECWGFYRKMEVPTDELSILWPEAKSLPVENEAEAARAERKMWPILEATYYGPESGVWYYDVILRSDDKGSAPRRLYERDYMVCPWIVWRYRKAAGEVQGQSPAMAALADVRTCDEAVRVRLESASLRVCGIFTYTDEGGFNPDTFYPESGSLVQVTSNSRDNPTLRALEMAGDPQFGELVLEDHRTSVRRKFNDEGLPDPSGPIRSPTEYLERRRKAEQKQGMPYIRLVEEVARPALRLAMYLLAEAGQLPELAAVQPVDEDTGNPMPFMLNGTDIAVEFRHPLTIAQELTDAENIVRWSEFSQRSAGMAGWEAGAETQEIPAVLGEKMSIPQELITPEADRAEQMEAAREAQLMGAQQPQAGPVPQMEAI